MHRIPGRRMAAGVLIFLAAAFVASAEAGLSLKEILARNVQASGGKARIGQVKNLSFKTGAIRNIVSAAGDLKVLTGKDPVVTEAVLVRRDKVRRNSLNVISDVTDPERTVYRTLAKLYAGVFSLAKFEGQLKLEGLKSFGAAKLYHLTPKLEGAAVGVHFYLDAGDFRLKRLVFQGSMPGGDKYEVNYDFAPFEEAEGLSLPLSWFVSQVGTRGNMTGVTELKANQPLAGDFFTKAEINAGKAESAPGEMKGNVLEFNSSPFGLTIATNWTIKDVDKAGFRTGDKLTLLVGGDESEIAFYALANEVPPPDELAKGARLLAPMLRGGEGFAVQIIGGGAASLQGKLKPLTAISVKKKAK